MIVSKIIRPCNLPGNLPGAAAPILDIPYLSRSNSSFSSSLVDQPLELVDYGSLKKSIWRFLLFSRRFLKHFTDGTPTSSSDKLFQRLTTRWEKTLYSGIMWLFWICPRRRSASNVNELLWCLDSRLYVCWSRWYQGFDWEGLRIQSSTPPIVPKVGLIVHGMML